MGILAAIALPAYMDYTRKAKLAEVVNVAGAIKTSQDMVLDCPWGWVGAISIIYLFAMIAGVITGRH